MAGTDTPTSARTIVSSAAVPQPVTGEFVARGGGMGANLVGVALLGRYQVQERIGDGGMGTVYLAEHTTILKKFAVKVLSPELSVRPDHVDRFMREARSASMINHPNVVEITDFGITPDGQPFFVMEYLQGQDLAQLLSDVGSLPWKRVRHVVLQLCHALQAAHDQGVIHRDMKPGNIVLVKRGNNPEHVKVLDFGIAKVLGQEAEGKGLTQSGMVVGTPEYMSPEQGWGQPVDHRGDIYAVGVIMFELLTGKIPFGGTTMMEILNRHMFEVPDVKHPNIPDEVAAIILKAMQKDRSLRFQSMNELAAAIEAVGTGASPVTVVDEEIKTPWGPVTARFSAVPTQQPQPRSWVWLSVLSAVIAVGALVFALWPDPPPPPAPATPAPVVVAQPEPPPPEVDPKPVVLPPEVEKVNFTITTPGIDAQILDARDEGIYGMTNDPSGVMVRKSEEPIELILRAKGYEDNRFTMIPSQDKRFEKVLVAVAVAPPTKGSKPVRHDPKPNKQDTPKPPETKTSGEDADSGLGTDLKNPFDKK